MASLQEIRQGRLEKLAKLRELNMPPYPAATGRTHDIAAAVRDFSTLSAAGAPIVIAGRVMALRAQGALCFLDLFDGSGTIQALLKREDGNAESFARFQSLIDIGDFVRLSGTLFTTKRGERTLSIADWSMLGKSLRPLPEKWEGLQDAEERLRERYLDLLTRPELREVFVRKAKFWQVIRTYLANRGFLEVETPYLEVTTGGAEARPFKTHHHDFDMDVYLRISVGELWQKRLMAAGFPKTFEIGRVFRNEGTSAEHLQEFTNVEFYMTYADYEEGMTLVQDLYRTVAREVFGTTSFSVGGHTFDLAHDWPRLSYGDEIKARTGIDIGTASVADMRSALRRLGVSYEGASKERLVDSLWKHCRKQISGPAFLVGHPVLVAPLAKLDDKRPGTVQMFQPLIAGSEVGRGYSELNDPIDQAERFAVQQKLIEAGDEEAMMPDDDFVTMLEHGMPPTCGYGFGERLFSLLSGLPIRETQLFPLLRPKKGA